MHEPSFVPSPDAARHFRPYAPAQHDGFIDDWLVAGPQAVPVDPARFPAAAFKPAVARALHKPGHGLGQAPLQFAPALAADPQLAWRVAHCDEDHFVYGTDFYPTPHFVQCWAYAAVELPDAWQGAAALTTNGPADVWLNDAVVHRGRAFAHQRPRTATFALSLPAGRHYLLVRFACVGVRECPMVMALQLRGAAQAQWLLPTAPQWESSRARLESAFARAALDRDVFARHDAVTVHWPAGEPLQDNITLRLVRQDGRIYSEQRSEGRTLPRTKLGFAYQFPADAYTVHLMPELQEYYAHGRRVERRLPVYLTGNQDYARQRQGTYAERRQDALSHAAQGQVSVFNEIAKLALGHWPDVRWDVFRAGIARIRSRADCSDFYLVGLLGAVFRYGDDERFPADVLAALKEGILSFRYWLDEPGADAMCFWSENHQILFHCCEILAGQLYPDAIFANNGMTGEAHRALGEERALSWLRKRAGGGFREWDSNTYFEEDVLALTHLADLAANDEVHAMATVVLDKLFFGLAVNSFRGVFGSTHGRSYAPALKSGLREATSGLTRLLWGMGIWNEKVLGVVSLACAEAYRLPPVIEALALDPAPEIWNRERHAGALEAWCDLEDGAWCVNKVTYKTPDYMLASAQDYQPGAPGYQQHIWQATFGPAAAVFVTHPPCLSEDGAHRPNSWHGNVRLPRTVQYKDVLIALHDLGDEDWLGFTHAYFPTFAFDAYYLQGGWAFARAGDGYLALTASTGLRFVDTGRNAHRELRAPGPQTAWILQMGRKALDGTFRQFRERVQALRLECAGLQVAFASLRGDTFALDMQGPFLRNGAPEPTADFPHYDNPYSTTPLQAETMDIQFQDLLLRLHLT